MLRVGEEGDVSAHVGGSGKYARAVLLEPPVAAVENKVSGVGTAEVREQTGNSGVSGGGAIQVGDLVNPGGRGDLVGAWMGPSVGGTGSSLPLGYSKARGPLFPLGTAWVGIIDCQFNTPRSGSLFGPLGTSSGGVVV